MKYLLSRKILILSIFASLISCTTLQNYHNTQGPIFTGKYSVSGDSLPSIIKVVTFNIKFSNEVQQALWELETSVNLSNADVILLQEMDEAGVDYIAKNLNMDYVYYPACFQRHQKNFGNAILTKWPLSAPQKFILPHANPINGQRRIAVAATVGSGSRSLRVYSVHTEVNVLSLEKRLDQVQFISSTIADSVSHVIIGGDFNSVFNSTIQKMENIFGQRALKNISQSLPPTFQPDPLGLIQLNLDHLFAKGVTVTGVGVFKNSTASDHLPVWAEIQLSDTKSILSHQPRR